MYYVINNFLDETQNKKDSKAFILQSFYLKNVE